VAKNPDLLSGVCALIEFERTEFAVKARKTLNSDQDGKLKARLIRFRVEFGCA
jgi:hypothetical protein